MITLGPSTFFWELWTGGRDRRQGSRITRGSATTPFGNRSKVRLGVGAEPATGHIPFTPRAKKSLELALREANSLGHKEIRPVHMMLGILREREGIAVRALADLGLDIDELIANISDEYSRKYTKDQPSGPE